MRDDGDTVPARTSGTAARQVPGTPSGNARANANGTASLQRSEGAAPAVTSSAPDTSTAVEVPRSVRDHVEQVVGHAPAAVTVRQGPQAAARAEGLGAEAFTEAGVVYLAGDRPLSSTRGRQLLAHEVTHVAQQTAAPPSLPSQSRVAAQGRLITSPRDVGSHADLEHQARVVEAMAGGPAAPSRPLGSDARDQTSAAGPAALPSPMPVSPPGPRARTHVSPAVANAIALGVPKADTPRIAGPTSVRDHSQRRPISQAADPQDPPDASRLAAHAAPAAFTPRVTPPMLHAAPGVPPPGASSQANAQASASSPPTAITPGRTNTLPTITQLRERDEPASSASSGEPSSPVQLTSAEQAEARQRGTDRAQQDSQISGQTSPESVLDSPDSIDPQPSLATATDRTWLETHAKALYPLIRAELRSELLHDRERRGRLVREQR